MVIGRVFDYTAIVASDRVTVRARIRRRTAHDDPLPTKKRWDEEPVTSYEETRAAICSRVSTEEIVLAWYVDRA